MPSERHLTRYKNSINQEPGVQESMLKWMSDEAKARNIPAHGMCGGLMCDEVSIQVLSFFFYLFRLYYNVALQRNSKTSVCELLKETKYMIISEIVLISNCKIS